ncbi:NUDIX hydrolase (plasmid) [Streptomyces sp. NBC_01717]|uniref:NUDIX hydrolase n=1 Tax=Streptomyces sp. NBC_01717 TaxID=2975918 RepID=UPI002E2FEB0C|nr:NUDIX hydrolase [Streptomyces sp. NBC_01717]
MTKPTHAIAVRACAVILGGDKICLIHRRRSGGDLYSLPGGLLHPDEERSAALARELKEELDLDLAGIPDWPQLRWVQDQATSRPGSDQLFRRRHLIYVLPIPVGVRDAIATTEQDAEDSTSVVWVPPAEAASYHLYPAVGEALSQLAGPIPAPGPAMLPAITDMTYSWR